MVNPGDISDVVPMRTWSRDEHGHSIEVWRIGFLIKKKVKDYVTLPVEGFTAEAARQAMLERAQVVIDTMNLF